MGQLIEVVMWHSVSCHGDVMVTSWRIATMSHVYCLNWMSLRTAYPIVRMNFVTVCNTFIVVYRHTILLYKLRHTVTCLTSNVTSNAMTYRHPVSVVMKRTCVSINTRKITIVSSTVHEIFNIDSGSYNIVLNQFMDVITRKTYFWLHAKVMLSL